MKDPRNNQLRFVQVQPKPCEVCGDLWLYEKIITCFQCQSTSEHAYCMSVPLFDIPEIWMCEECRASEDRASAKPQSSHVVLNGTVQSVGSNASRLTEDYGRLVKQEKAVGVGTGEVIYLSTDEAIELSQGSKKLQNSSPCQWGASKWSVSSSQSANMTMSTTAGLTTCNPSFSNISLQRVETNSTVRPKDSEFPDHGGGEHIIWAQQQECQIRVKQEPVDMLMPAKRVEMSNAIRKKAMKQRLNEVHQDFLMPSKRIETSKSTIEKDVIKKEPEDVLNDKRVETSNQAIKKNLRFAPSTSMGPLPIVGSGVLEINAKRFEVHKSNLPKPLHNMVPVAVAVWSGSIEVAHSASCTDVYSNLQAIFPCIVHRKAMELSTQLPGVLSCTTIPCSVIMSEVFQNEFPNPEDIALYFIPGNMERSKKEYEVLLGFLEMKDMVLRSHLSGSELLILPSKGLHENFQGSNSFLWGVYYPRKGPLSCDAISQVQCECFDGHRDVKQLLNQVKVEKLNSFSLPPPGLPTRVSGDVAGLQHVDLFQLYKSMIVTLSCYRVI